MFNHIKHVNTRHNLLQPQTIYEIPAKLIEARLQCSRISNTYRITHWKCSCQTRTFTWWGRCDRNRKWERNVCGYFDWTLKVVGTLEISSVACLSDFVRLFFVLRHISSTFIKSHIIMRCWTNTYDILIHT